MLPASWSAGACPRVRPLDAWAVFAFGDSPRCSPNTAPTPVTKIAASPTIRIRYRIVVPSLGGQPRGHARHRRRAPGGLAFYCWTCDSPGRLAAEGGSGFGPGVAPAASRRRRISHPTVSSAARATATAPAVSMMTALRVPGEEDATAAVRTLCSPGGVEPGCVRATADDW